MHTLFFQLLKKCPLHLSYNKPANASSWSFGTASRGSVRGPGAVFIWHKKWMGTLRSAAANIKCTGSPCCFLKTWV